MQRWAASVEILLPRGKVTVRNYVLGARGAGELWATLDHMYVAVLAAHVCLCP